jgi:hypothetical protein
MANNRQRCEKQRPIASKQPVMPDTEYVSILSTLDKRNLHKDTERERRTGIKNLLEDLKRELPTVSNNKRAVTMEILHAASIMCRKLTKEHELYITLKKRHTWLLDRVTRLREQLIKQRQFNNL